MKHTLGFNNMLEEEKFLLAEQKWDFKVREATLVEAQERRLNPHDSRDLLVELVELHGCLVGVKEPWE
jgi:hypothetical protein